MVSQQRRTHGNAVEAPAPPPVVPQPREEVLAYEAVAPKPEPALPRAVSLPAPEAVPLPAELYPRHLYEGDRAGPDAVAGMMAV